MNISDIKVDRCPFCGGKSRVHKYYSQFYARCNKCKSYSAPYDTPEQAAAAWNKRAYTLGVDIEQSPKKNDRACTKCDYANFDDKDGRLFCCRWNSYNSPDDWCVKFKPRTKLYLCDPNKRSQCNNSPGCFKNGGECMATQCEEYAMIDENGKPIEYAKEGE